MGVCNCSMLFCTLLYVHSSFAIIFMGKRELVALLSLSSWCLLVVVWLFLAVPLVCLQLVIVVFPDHFEPQTLLDPDINLFADWKPTSWYLPLRIPVVCGQPLCLIFFVIK